MSVKKEIEFQQFNDFNDYQLFAKGTAIYPGQGTTLGLLYTALGLVGEAGEIANKAKKILRDDGGEINPERYEQIAKEAGDVMWYLALLLDELGVDMSDAAKGNLLKLYDRMERNELKGSGDNR
jgi:NTP pyrophosphatase (non-canonical NTP hydrolase)